MLLMQNNLCGNPENGSSKFWSHKNIIIIVSACQFNLLQFKTDTDFPTGSVYTQLAMHTVTLRVKVRFGLGFFDSGTERAVT